MNEYNYFTVADLIKSHTARLRQIDNQPSDEVRKELEMTVCKLNVIGLYAHMMGATIQVTSGYRCEELNKVVGGVKTSLHMQGRAVDFVVLDTKIKHELYDAPFVISDAEVKHKLHDALKEEACIKLLGICELIEYTNYIHVGFLRHSLEVKK